MNITDDKKREITAYFTVLIAQEESAKGDLKDNVKECWQRHLNQYSCKKDKSLPWPGSSDFKSGLIETADTTLEAQFAASVNTVKLIAISASTSKEANEAAKKVEGFFNNYWIGKSKFKKTLLESFQYWLVEGQLFFLIKPYTDTMFRKVKRYKYVEKIVETVQKAIKYVVGKEGEMQKEPKRNTDYLGAIWESLPTIKVGWDRTANTIDKCKYTWYEFDLSLSEIRKKEKDSKWFDIDSLLKKSDKVNQLPAQDSANDSEEEEKNDYQGFDDTKTNKKKFYYLYADYDVNDDGIDEKIELVISKDEQKLHFIEKNGFFDERVPIVSAPFYTVAGRLTGQSNPMRLAPLADEFDTLQNQIIDNNTITNSFCGTIVEQGQVTADKVKIRPGFFLPVKSHDLINVWKMDNRIGDMSYQQNTVLSIFERKSLVNDTMVGRQSQDQNKQTYRGMVTLLKQNAVSLNRPMQNFQEALVEGIKQTIMCLYEYMPAEGIKYTYLKENGKEDEPADYESAILRREDLEYMDEFNIGALSGVVDVMLDSEKQIAMFLLQAFGNDQSGEINTFALKKNVVETNAPRLVKDVIRESKEVQALKAMMMKGQELMAKEQALMAKEQALMGLQQQILGEKAQQDEQAFMQDLVTRGVPEEKWPDLLATFRKEFIARNGGVQQPAQPQVPAEGQPPQMPEQGSAQ